MVWNPGNIIFVNNKIYKMKLFPLKKILFGIPVIGIIIGFYDWYRIIRFVLSEPGSNWNRFLKNNVFNQKNPINILLPVIIQGTSIALIIKTFLL